MMCAITTSKIPSKSDTVILLPANLLILFWSFAPKACATGIVNPLVRPSAAPTIKEFIEPTPPTAARASVLTYRPTRILSTKV